MRPRYQEGHTVSEDSLSPERCWLKAGVELSQPNGLPKLDFDVLTKVLFDLQCACFLTTSRRGSNHDRRPKAVILEFESLIMVINPFGGMDATL